MPLVTVEVPSGLGSNRLRAVGEAIHDALVQALAIPDDDDFIAIHEHTPETLRILRTRRAGRSGDHRGSSNSRAPGRLDSVKDGRLEHFTAALRPVFSTATSDQAARYLTVTQRMNNQLQSEMIPPLAEALHRTPAQVDGLLLSRYPYFATGVSQLDGIVARTRALVRLVRTNVNNFDQTASIPLSSWAATTMPWLFLIPGLLLAVFGAALIAGVGLEQRTSPSLPASGVASR
jgi:hypothetical protein